MLAPAELYQLDEETLREALKKVRAKKRAEKQAQEAPLPPYVRPEGEEDLLSFEYGLELAFRPTSNPDAIPSEKLAPLLYVLPQGRIRERYSYGTQTPIRVMSLLALEKFAKHIGAPEGRPDSLSTCGANEVEFPSPILSRWSQLEWYYARIKALADATGMTTDNEHKNSGGGHIHVSPLNGEWSDNQKYTILLGYLDNPWLCWVFNDPDDSSTAVYPGRALINAMFDWYEEHKREGSWWRALELSGNIGVRRNSGIKKTMEFRFFQAPKNWDEQRLHVLFLDKWLKHMLRDLKKIVPSKPPVPKWWLPQDLSAINYGFARHQFHKLLDELGLSRDDYEVFVQRNMKTRFVRNWPRN
jgi:hypothetical protein